jgi:siroheme synthase
MGCPADAGLLSRRAEAYLRECDVVFHDRLIPEAVLRGLGDRAVYVGKIGGQSSIAQEEIHRRILAEARRGRLVVRLHGGDPGIYGHLGEELEFLTARRVRVDVIPAVTAAQVAAARARTALTHRGDGHRLTILTAHPGEGRPFEPPPPSAGNLAIYMGTRDVRDLARKLIAAGWKRRTPLVVGERLGCSDERITGSTLGGAARLRPLAPAVFLVGMRRFRALPHTLFTGSDPDRFLRHGPLLHWPVVDLSGRRLSPVEPLPRLAFYRVLFTSGAAVRAYFAAYPAERRARREWAAVGSSTQRALARLGLRAVRLDPRPAVSDRALRSEPSRNN